MGSRCLFIWYGHGGGLSLHFPMLNFGYDVYTPFQVFTGRHPFNEFTESVTIAKIIDGERPDRPEALDLTDSIWNVTLSCWKKNPVKRPRMMEVLRVLHEWLVVFPPMKPI